MITTNCTDNILWLVDSWYVKLSIEHHLWTVRPVVKDLSMLKNKCWWIFKLWHSYLCLKTWDFLLIGAQCCQNTLGYFKEKKNSCLTNFLHFGIISFALIYVSQFVFQGQTKKCDLETYLGPLAEKDNIV